MNNRYLVIQVYRLTEAQFDLARGTDLMEALIRNAIELQVMRRYGPDAGDEYSSEPRRLDDDVVYFLASNATGPYYIETQPGQKIMIYFAESSDAVAFKLRFHNAETRV